MSDDSSPDPDLDGIDDSDTINLSDTIDVSDVIDDLDVIDDSDDSSPENEVIYTVDVNQMRQQEHYTNTMFDATYNEARIFCENFPNTRFAAFDGQENDIDQRWLTTYQPWSNVRKYNRKWLDANTRTKEYRVKQVQPWHTCAFFKNGRLYSDDCNIGIHKLVCEWVG